PLLAYPGCTLGERMADDRTDYEETEGVAPLYPIGSVGNALRILLMFRETPDVRVADAAKELGVARSTAHRLLARLQHQGFVVQDATSKAYSTGPVLLGIGLSALAKVDLRSVARPH